MPFLEPGHRDTGGDRSGVARQTALWRSRLLPRHRTVVRPVPLEHAQRRRGQLAPHGWLPCAGRPAALHGQRGHRSDELRHEIEKQNLAPYEYTTSSVTIMKFKNGSIGKCAAIVDCLQPYYFHTHLVGSEGSLLDNKFHSMKLGTNKHAWSSLAMKMLDSGDVSDHPYQAQFEAFFNALDKGKEMPLTGFADAARSHEVIFAADKSAATGKPVKL